MKTYTITEACQLDNDQLIPAIEGKIVWVGPTTNKPAVGTRPAWHFQKFLLADPAMEKDEADSSIYCVLKNGEDVTDLKFKLVRFESKEGKDGLDGLRKSVCDFNGKTYADIAVTVAPTVLAEDDGPPAEKASTNSTTPPASKPAAKKQYYSNQTPEDPRFIAQTLTYFAGAALHTQVNDPDLGNGSPNSDGMAEIMFEMFLAKEKALAMLKEHYEAVDAAESKEG